MSFQNLSLVPPSPERRAKQPSFGIGKFLVKRFLSLIEVGRIAVELPTGERIDRIGRLPGPHADIRFTSWRGLVRALAQGDIGLASGYLEGAWTSPDVEALIELGAMNGSKFLNAFGGLIPFRFIYWLSHRANENTRIGSRRNIEAHYDLGNDFYRLWLDRRMIYSSAIYRFEDETLERAQNRKLERIVEKLEILTGSTVLEIGSGWGGLAASIARAGVDRVTGVTLSPSQLTEARSLIVKEQLSGRVEFKLQDYRDVRGRFDRIVSIEMIEGVGRKFIPKYFETIRDCLKPGGLCVIQAITIADAHFSRYCRGPDFIQRFVFPGGFLPSKQFLRESLEKADLKIVASENFGASYALTLREWRKRFLEAWPQIETLGFDAQFKRLWEYYLCYSEAGFRSGMVDVGLYSLQHARE
jgi:cyclopropane-fatty-acyl-phospholipid synthase